MLYKNEINVTGNRHFAFVLSNKYILQRIDFDAYYYAIYFCFCNLAVPSFFAIISIRMDALAQIRTNNLPM